ncbi:hypothetical protein ACQX74_15215, partial [Staphylococcus aureus]|uniref:hypothetical protein n=1 Tax=Staphylococcus aureus TaxID=1280 RepID=UPI003D22ED59
SMINHQPPADRLIEPGEEGPHGSTHFQNDTEMTEKTNRMNASAAKGNEGYDKAKDPRDAHKKPEKHPGEVKLAPEKGPHHPAKTKACLFTHLRAHETPLQNSYAVFCLKKKKTTDAITKANIPMT